MLLPTATLHIGNMFPEKADSKSLDNRSNYTLSSERPLDIKQ